MKNLIILFILASSFYACTETATTSGITTEVPADNNSTDRQTDPPKVVQAPLPDDDPSHLKRKGGSSNTLATEVAPENFPEKHNCTFKGKLLEENDFFIREKQYLVGIVANDKTKDPNLGDSYRILEVHNTDGCQLEFEGTLAINRSPDFPYYLEKKLYRAGDDFVIIRGFDKFYIYNFKTKKLSAPFNPEYKGNPDAADAQSGMILYMQRDGNNLMGTAQDFGSFSFDLKTRKALLPAAEYGGNQLFFVPEVDGYFHAVIPVQNDEDEGIILKRLFASEKKLNAKLPDNVANNRFLVLNTDPGTTPPQHVVIDMEKGIEIILPEAVAELPAGKILAWVKKNK